MKREELPRHLRGFGCEFKREGGAHSIWISPAGKMQAIPKHNDIQEFLARAICRKLQVPEPARRGR